VVSLGEGVAATWGAGIEATWEGRDASEAFASTFGSGGGSALTTGFCSSTVSIGFDASTLGGSDCCSDEGGQASASVVCCTWGSSSHVGASTVVGASQPFSFTSVRASGEGEGTGGGTDEGAGTGGGGVGIVGGAAGVAGAAGFSWDLQ